MSNARDIADAGHQLVAYGCYSGTTLHQGFNVSSTIGGTSGNRIINFENDLEDSNYVVVTGSAMGGSNTTNTYERVVIIDEGSFELETISNGAFNDTDKQYFAVFR